jgi:hypothetical protein
MASAGLAVDSPWMNRVPQLPVSYPRAGGASTSLWAVLAPNLLPTFVRMGLRPHSSNYRSSAKSAPTQRHERMDVEPHGPLVSNGWALVLGSTGEGLWAVGPLLRILVTKVHR